jgi:hypothetical protein
VDSAAAFDVGVALEAMLLTPMLRPMMAGDDTLGEYGLDLIARGIAARDIHGFSAVLASQLEARR